MIKGTGKNLIFVDCEGWGPAPAINNSIKFEFGAVAYKNDETFHGKGATKEVFAEFEKWLLANTDGRPVFVSDNPAYDWQFINYYFHDLLGRNPFGYSARRISDFYAGLSRNWGNTQKWKRFRVTPHDHNPVHDAQGNVEAFRRIMNGDL